MRYRDFEKDVRDVFGFDKSEARALADELSAAGFDTRHWPRDDPLFWDIAVELATTKPEPEEEFPLDPHFPGDAYIDAGEEWELSADYEAE